MHRHDPDLIASVAEDLLAGDLAAQAAAEIAACPECSRELALQRAALFALHSAPAAALTGDEATRMRAAVAEAVGIAPAPAAAPAPPRRRAPWGAIAVTAASLAGVMAVLPVLGIFSPGGDHGDAATTAAVAESTDLAEMRDAPGSEGDGMEEDGQMVLSAPAPEDPEIPETAATQEAGGEEAPTTTAVPAAEPGSLPPDTLIGEDAVKEFFAAGEAASYAAGDTDPDERTARACSVAAEERLGAGYRHVAIPVALGDGREAILFVSEDGGMLAAFDLEDCRALLVLP